MSIAVTGARGSIGRPLVKRLHELGRAVHATDIDEMDVTDWLAVRLQFAHFQPDVVFHLAGAKHAPAGEEDPFACSQVNILGTKNVLDAAGDAKVILASTCKACDPVTAYGATKLIAERMVLNAGGSVARLYNVVETGGNVFETWRELPEDDPIPVTPCIRYFISIDEAVDLFLQVAEMPPGRYTVSPRPALRMVQVANQTYPGRKTTLIPPRRGDRLREPLFASHEKAVEGVNGLLQISSPHDAAVSLVA